MRSAAYQILRELATETTMELVKLRLLFGLKFFDNHCLKDSFARSEVKLVLLLVQLANPDEVFSADEKAILGARQQQALPQEAPDLTTCDTRKSSSAKKSKK